MPNASTLLLGRGELYIAEYSTYSTDTSLVLSTSEKVGLIERCFVSTELTYKENIKLEPMLFGTNLSLRTTIVDSSKANLNMFLGRDRTDGAYVDMDIDSFSTRFRLEARFTYPDRVTQLGLIIPKVYITSTNGINMVSLFTPSKLEISFSSIPIGNLTWGTKTGRLLFL